MSLPPGLCLCTGLCPGQPQLCPFVGPNECTNSPCLLPCPTASVSVPGLCQVPDPGGCLCSNFGGVPCP